MSLTAKLAKFLSPTQPQSTAVEAAHWNEIERRAKLGDRIFWLNHPRVWHHYHRKSLVDGLSWQEWITRQLCGPASSALELGCGNGAVLGAFLDQGFLLNGTGLDLDISRFTTASTNPKLKFIAGDVNKIALQPNQYDLIYALQSFHHFDEIDHIMEQVHGALTPNGYFVLDEYVGPNRFQWTDLQLSVTSHLLCLLPKALRWYANGVEKQAEGRSTPEQVITVCPSEAIRSDEIVAAFNRHFDVVHHRKPGGTIQHILYSGIIQNFPDNDPATDQVIDSIDGIETAMIEHGMLPSDFAILIGRKRAA